MTNAPYVQAYKTRNKANGICTDCTEPTAGKSSLCEKHKKKYNERAIIRRAKKKALGICISCRQERDPHNKTYCSYHKVLRQNKDIALHGGMKLILGQKRISKNDLEKARNNLAKVINKKMFTDEQYYIVECRFFESFTLRKTGEIINKSHEMVRQIEEDIAKKIISYLKINNIDII